MKRTSFFSFLLTLSLLIGATSPQKSEAWDFVAHCRALLKKRSFVVRKDSGREGLRLAALQGPFTKDNPLHVMIIDGGHPDPTHQDFLDAEGQSILREVTEQVMNQNLDRPVSWDPANEPEKKPHDLNSHRARFVSWWIGLWKHTEVGKTVDRAFRIRSLLFVTAVAAAYQSFTSDVTFGHSAQEILIGSGWESVIWWPTYLLLVKKVPLLADLKTAILRSKQVHSTHVTGTIGRGFEGMRDRIQVHTADMHLVGGIEPNSPAYLPGLISNNPRVRDLWYRIEGSLRKFRQRSNAFETEAKHFLETFFDLNHAYYANLAQHINKNNIRAVNMSYGIGRTRLIEAFLDLYRKHYGINAAAAFELSSYIAKTLAEGYKELFRACPNTAFFIAAGNDGSSVLDGESVFENIDESNVFVSAAATNGFELAEFSSFGHSDPKSAPVDSAGFGVDQVSSLPGGWEGPLSGTSMASPNNMLLFTYLIAADPSLTIQEALQILRRGSLHTESLRTEVHSGGVTVSELVLAEYLLHQIKKHGHLADFEIPPFLHVDPTLLKRAERPTNFAPASEGNGKDDDFSADTKGDPAAQTIFQNLKRIPAKVHEIDPLVVAHEFLIPILEGYLDHLNGVQSSQPATGIQWSEENVRLYLELISSYQVFAQRKLVPYFISEPGTVANSNMTLDLPAITEPFAAFVERTLQPLTERSYIQRLRNEDVFRLLAHTRYGPIPTQEELEGLMRTLIKTGITLHYLRATYTRIGIILEMRGVKGAREFTNHLLERSAHFVESAEAGDPTQPVAEAG